MVYVFLLRYLTVMRQLWLNFLEERLPNKLSHFLGQRHLLFPQGREAGFLHRGWENSVSSGRTMISRRQLLVMDKPCNLSSALLECSLVWPTLSVTDMCFPWGLPGGAVLVSPSKVKPPGLEQRRRASSQDGLETLKKDITKVAICISEENLVLRLHSLMINDT